MKSLRVLVLILCVSAVAAEGRDTEEGWRLRNEVALALLHIGLSPGDLTVRDMRAWKSHAERRPDRQPRPDRPYHDVSVFLDLEGFDLYRGAARGANGRTWIQRVTGRGVGVDR